MSDPTTPLTVMQDTNDPEWQRLIARFYRRRCDQCGTPLPTNAPSKQRYCNATCQQRHWARRMMTAIRRIDDRKEAA